MLMNTLVIPEGKLLWKMLDKGNATNKDSEKLFVQRTLFNDAV